MKQYIIPTAAVLMVAASTTFAAITYFNYIVWAPLTDGTFRSDWVGNAWTVTLNGSSIDGTALVWQLSTQAAGIATFQSDARIVSPTSGNPTRTCWTVVGTAESPNTGTIRLTGTDTDLRFNPVTRKLEWHGYNNWLGRVPLGDEGACFDNPADLIGIIDDTELATLVAGGSISASSAGFVGRVKIIGNAGWTSVFDAFYSQGVRFNASLFNTTLQRIRKNVGLLTRNLSSTQKNWSALVGDKMFLIDQSAIFRTSGISSSNLNDIRSLIVVGGDIYIDQNFTGATANNPKGIIVLKNENGVGGNVYVGGNVKNISASIFAEGTIYSGESPTNIYNDNDSANPDEIATPKPSQLYILGALISRNTIGGASRIDVLCPYNEACTFDSATKYDLNYFRGFQAEVPYNPLDPYRAYKDATLDDYSLIIETDRRTTTNPPPGFE